MESAIRWWRDQPLTATDENALGSIVTVGGPLLSYPTLTRPCPTPLLIFARLPPTDSPMPKGAFSAFKKGFSTPTEVLKPGEGMPRSKDEWEPVMRFWSEKLGRRKLDGLYEVMSGAASA